jgi:hypothetical protein
MRHTIGRCISVLLGSALAAESFDAVVPPHTHEEPKDPTNTSHLSIARGNVPPPTPPLSHSLSWFRRRQHIEEPEEELVRQPRRLGWLLAVLGPTQI